MMKLKDSEYRFNPYAPGFFENPYPFYDRLRENDPYHRSFMGTWILTRYDDIQEALVNPNLSSDLRNWTGFDKRYKDKESIPWFVTHSVLTVDPPNHKPLKNHLNKSFLESSLKKLNAQIPAIVKQKLEKLEKLGSFDFIPEFALAVPLETIYYVFGIEEADKPIVKKWSTDISKLIEPLPILANLEAADQSIQEFSQYLKEKILQKQLDKTKDEQCFLTSLIADPHSESFEKDEYILPNLILMFMAGHETTVNLIGNGIFALLNNPDQLKLLLENPELTGSAVEEMLRYDPPQQLAWRSALCDLKIGEHSFKKGDQLMLLLGSANKDPAYFSNPHKFDIKRMPNPHLSFGKGQHSCLGSWLARLQGKIAIREFVERFPAMEITSEGVRWFSNFSFRGLEKMPILTNN